jgi:predicted Zn-dependent protease
MTSLLIRTVTLCCLLALAAGCASAPHTQRSQFIMIPESRTVAMGRQAAQKIKKKEPVSHDPALVEPVRRIGRRIAAQTNKDYDWEFNVIDKDVPNAFALPGGKVFVYKGLMDMVDSDDELATVIAHEIAHAIARHGAERLSVQLGASLVGQAAGMALGFENPAVAKAFSQAYGMASQVGVILPYSRTQEYEADHIGLVLMAKAGYDPEEALDFWRKMMKLDKGKAPPAWLSTHPPSPDRLAEIKADLPMVKRKYYHPR